MQTQKRIAVDQTLRLYRLINYRYQELKDKPEITREDLISQEISVVLDDFDNGSFLFVYDKDGVPIYESKTADNEQYVIDNILKIGQNKGGFLKFETQENDKKINNLAFVKKFKQANWVVGFGMSIDEIDRVLKEKREKHSNKITGFILKIVTLTLFLYIASIVKYRYITDKMTKEIKIIVGSLKKASKNYTFIDRSQIKFDEFREITSHANHMISKIKEKNMASGNLNKNLENLISEKTNELQKSVIYSKKLLENQDRFVKNAIHEINTPLTIILMNIDLYNLKYDNNKYLFKIEAAVKVLQNIYGDLSFIAKKDRVDYSLDMIDLTAFVKNRVDYFNDVALGNMLEIKSDIEEEIFLLFNEFELQRICDNNISNAIKYSFINEVVHVRLYRDTDCIVFEVENKGEQVKFPEKLFDRYYREDDARGGFGLGLNIVKEICDKKDVKIEVVSQKESTKFRYFFECKVNA